MVGTCRQLSVVVADNGVMPLHPTLSEVRRSFAGMMRTEVKAAAGADTVVNPTEAQTLRPFLKAAANDLGPGDHAVNDVMDAAMARAATGWGAVNQKRGSG